MMENGDNETGKGRSAGQRPVRYAVLRPVGFKSSCRKGILAASLEVIW